ncbi:MAG: gluconeogenesis factor YvcK family protein [Acidobacteriota bacterium]
MLLREITIGCFGGGTGLPSLLGGLKRNPWLSANAVVTMFDSGGSSGQLRDELGVLPPGDILRCALALARNEGEARRVLLSRLPTIEHARLSGHTGGNLLLSMMQQYTGDFLAAIGGLRALLGCRGQLWPVSVEQAMLCAEYADGSIKWGEVEVDRGHASGHEVRSLWLEPDAHILPEVRDAIAGFDAVTIGPGSFYTSLMPTLLVTGVREALGTVKGPIILIANLLTEGEGMRGFTAAQAVDWVAGTIGRPVDVLLFNTAAPGADSLARYEREQKRPLPLGSVPKETEVVEGGFWRTDIARHDRRRLSYAVWSVLSRRLLA